MYSVRGENKKKIKGFRPRGTVHVCLRNSVFPSYFLRDKKKQNGDEPKKIAKKKLMSSPNNTTTNDNNNNGDRKWRKGFLKATPFFAVYNDAPKPNVKSILISSCFLLFLSLYPVCGCVL
jgi:hypothetical protein